MPTDLPSSLDEAVVLRMATVYLSRYSASSRHLTQVLDRKVQRWFRVRQLSPPSQAELHAVLDRVVARLVESGLVDDTAFALARARRLVEKGLPLARIRTDLKARGLDPSLDAFDTVFEHDAETQARRFAARKRLGPFRSGPRASFRDKDIRALIRAGFSPRLAIAVIADNSGDELGSDPDQSWPDE